MGSPRHNGRARSGKNDLAIERTIRGAPEAASNGKMNEQKQNRRFICDRNINTDRPQQRLP